MGFYEEERNISKEDCEDTMQYHVLVLSEDNVKYIGNLTDDDKELLIDYAFKLFGNSTNYQHIEDDMFVLANRVSTYRSNQLSVKIENSFYQNYPKRQSKHNEDARVVSFRKHIVAMYELMGGDCIGTTEGNKLKAELQAAYEAPEKYFTKKANINPSKKTISDYLESLAIPYTSKAREDFVKAIK